MRFNQSHAAFPSLKITHSSTFRLVLNHCSQHLKHYQTFLLSDHLTKIKLCKSALHLEPSPYHHHLLSSCSFTYPKKKKHDVFQLHLLTSRLHSSSSTRPSHPPPFTQRQFRQQPPRATSFPNHPAHHQTPSRIHAN